MQVREQGDADVARQHGPHAGGAGEVVDQGAGRALALGPGDRYDRFARVLGTPEIGGGGDVGGGGDPQRVVAVAADAGGADHDVGGAEPGDPLLAVEPGEVGSGHAPRIRGRRV